MAILLFIINFASMQVNYFRFRYLALLVGVVYLFSFGYFQRWDTSIRYGGDSWGYYGYLPATFIYGDLHDISDSYLKRFPYTNLGPHFPSPGGELPIAENGHRVIKYTCGVAILQLPFFAAGHAWAGLDGGYPQDGFSFPYVFCVLLGNLFYLLFGGYLLYLLLAGHFNPKIAFWTLLVLALGTNLFNFAVYRAGMSHAYLFSLYAGLMYATWRFYARPQQQWIVLAAICAGMITLIRPVEILCLAIPLAYGLTDRAKLQDRLKFWGEHWRWLFLAAGIFILCGIPQLLYWKYASGHWLFDSYPNEAFDFANAKIFSGLFSTQNGWLVYSPIMVLSLTGIIALLRKRDWLWPVLLILPLHIYIAYSWWCWYYINGFGSRPMVELYALLAIPLAYSFAFLDRRKWTSFLLVIMSTGVIGLQLFQNWQHSEGILWSEMANGAYYRSVFGKTEMSYDALVAFDSDEMQPDSTGLMRQKELVKLDFEEQDSTLDMVSSPVYRGQKALKITPEQKYASIYEGLLGVDGVPGGDWLQVSAYCYKEKKEFPWYTAPSIVVEFSDDKGMKKYRQVRIDSKLNNPGFSLWGGEPGNWGYVRLWVQVPKETTPETMLKVYFMVEQQVVYADDVSVVLWK